MQERSAEELSIEDMLSFQSFSVSSAILAQYSHSALKIKLLEI